MNLEPFNDERLLREKMLQHEFPFDERAWEKMEALLDSTTEPPSPGPAPGSTVDPLPGPAFNRSLVVLISLFIAGTGISTVLWQHFSMRRHESGKATLRTQAGRGGSSQGRSGAGLAVFDSLNRSGMVEQPFPTPLKGQTENSSNPAAYSGRAPQHFGVADSPLQQDREPASAHEAGRPETPTGTQEPGAEPDPGAGDFALPASDPDTLSGTQLLPAPPPTGALAMLPERRPTLHADTLPADSLMQPLPEPSREQPRWERAWIFGVNANTVDLDPLRWSVLPHLGHLMRYKLNERTAIQAEFILKYVSGYGLRTEFEDVTPGGSSLLVIENDQLLFFELPLLLKRTYRPEQSWLIGLKPSLNTNLFNEGSSSINIPPANLPLPRRDYTSRDPIRPFDLGITVGWEYRFHRLWALDLRYNQGLFDLSIDNFYNNTDIHLNSDFQVSLRYFVPKKQKNKNNEPRPLFPEPADRR